MNDDAARLIMGDAAVAATESGGPRRRRWFGRNRKVAASRTNCENCAAVLTGPYCGQCGQHAIDYRRSSLRFFADVLDSFLNWDSKFFETIALLLSRPWRLTNAFLAGQRVRYVHPLRLYLLISVAFFFGVHLLAEKANFQPGKHKPLTAQEKTEVEEGIKNLPPYLQGTVRDAVAKGETKKSDEPAAPTPGAEVTINGKPFLDFDPKGNHEDTPFEKWIEARVKAKIGANGINVKTFMLAVVKNLPVMMLCCIPLFAFVLKILYVRKHVLYLDHLIYALHIHAFAYLAIMIIGFGSAGLSRSRGNVAPLSITLLSISAVVLVFLSIKRVYRQGWFMTVFKFFVGGFGYFLILLLAIAATFFATLALPD